MMMQRIETDNMVLLDENEQLKLLVAWTDTAVPFSDEYLIHQLIETQAQQQPDTLALISPHTHVQFTYQEMNQRANQLAHFLRRQGVRPEVPVCVCLERSPELIIAWLAVMKAGGVYVPLDPSYPAARLSGMIQEIQPLVLLTQEKLCSLFATVEEKALLCLDRDGDMFAVEAMHNLENLL
ncbi:MAG: AMP-binding protein, partial [Ktedonobacteraceae bacterium]|nr:AMP-binding protein [Ktedonobacteraceae bacterium]